MIVIIFISLAVVYFLIQHLENRRKARNEEQHERKREAFQHLLDLLKEKHYPKEKE